MRDDKRNARPANELDDLDSRIDAALRIYAEPPELTEPRVALARIMERAQAERPRRGLRWWMWGLAGAAACLIAVMVTAWVVRNPRIAEIARMPKPPGLVAAPAHRVQSAVAEKAVPSLSRRSTLRRVDGPVSVRKDRPVTAKALPKLDVFPTPRPLSAQEEALIAFARHGPADVQRAVIQDQKHWDDPIIVADLQEQPPQARQQDQ